MFFTKSKIVPKIVFSISNRAASQKVNNIASKLKMKQTVADKLQLQKFLETEIKDGRIQQTINRTSKYDDGYTQFIEQFKQKHKQYSNIMDMTHYSNSPLNKTKSLREQELRVLQEFLDQKKEMIDQQINFKSTPKLETSTYQSDDEQAEDSNKNEFQPGEWETRSGFTINDQFFTLLIDRDSNTQVTTLQRINTFRQLVFIGNANGVIGYGKGKGYDFEQALINAIKNAKRNLIPIPLDLWLTCPLKLESSFNDFELEINPRYIGMNAYGNPTMAAMLMLAGITHCRFKCRSRNQVPYAMVYAFFKAVTQNTTPEEISQATGQKIYRQHFGKRIGRQMPINFEGV